MIVSVDEFWQDKTKRDKQKNNVSVQFATVIELTIQGEPIIQFMGDSLPSMKVYKHFKHYVPEIGDRVMLINNIIVGGYRFD